jgi:hypothetical protein
MLFGFGVLAEASKFCGEGELSATVWRKQVAGFGVGLRGAHVIAFCGVYTAEPIPRLRRVGVVNKNLPVKRASVVPTGKRGQAFGETQLCGEIVRPEPNRGLKARYSGIELATLHLYCAEQVKPVEILRVQQVCARVRERRGIVPLVRMKHHGQSADGLCNAGMRPGLRFSTLNLRSNDGQKISSVHAR